LSIIFSRGAKTLENYFAGRKVKSVKQERPQADTAENILYKFWF
jgi:hypothetical protein